MMTNFCQRNPRWAGMKLGLSSLTVGRYGCTTSCIADIATYFNPNTLVTPASLAMRPDLYTAPTTTDSGGKIIWKNISMIGAKFVSRLYGRDDRVILGALKDRDMAIMLEVSDGSHWVTAVRPTLFGGSFIVADPWTGAYVDVIKSYRNITGAALFRRA